MLSVRLGHVSYDNSKPAEPLMHHSMSETTACAQWMGGSGGTVRTRGSKKEMLLSEKCKAAPKACSVALLISFIASNYRISQTSSAFNDHWIEKQQIKYETLVYEWQSCIHLVNTTFILYTKAWKKPLVNTLFTLIELSLKVFLTMQSHIGLKIPGIFKVGNFPWEWTGIYGN